MSDHTKGRLVKDYGHTFGHIKAVPDDANKGISLTPTLFRYDIVAAISDPAEREANARRLVACWNAFEGISTEAIEAILAGRAADAIAEIDASLAKLTPKVTG